LLQIAETIEVNDNAHRMIRKLIDDLQDVTDDVTLTRLLSLHLVEIVETQDVSDEVIKALFKAIAENVDAVDDVGIITATLVRHFMQSMFASDEDAMGKLAGGGDPFRLATGDEDSQDKAWGAKPGVKIVATDEDPLKRVPGTKGRRIK
jgi:hypothetical protein